MKIGADVKSGAGEDHLLKRTCLRDRLQSVDNIRRVFVEEGGAELSIHGLKKTAEAWFIDSTTCKMPLLTEKSLA